MKWRKALFGSLAAALLVTSLTGFVAADISPVSLYAVLAPGQSVTETKTVTIPDLPLKADVVFSFDLTHSMSSIIASAKSKVDDILDELDATPGVSFNYGVMSYMDYPQDYNSCGYSASYGSPEDNDYAYNLDQAVTDDNSAVVSAINGLTLGFGGDGPQDYTRIFYESYADPNIGWRDGAKRVLVNFGDTVPHDCNLREGLSSTIWTTGCDPGRDEVMGTADDLDLLTVLANMNSEGVILLQAHTTSYAEYYWNYWTGITGGNFFVTSSPTLVDDIVNKILAAIETPEVTNLHLEMDSQCVLTMISNPGLYAGPLYSGESVDFEVTFTVPNGTEPGIYNCSVSAVDGAGVNYGDQEVKIVVYDPSAGFVTGGGWIDSQEGAYTANPSLTGKASFGFVAKYKKGANVPTGQTEFQFQVADLNFHSESYEWLIVNQGGTNAQFKGKGTINGQNGPDMEPFKFMLWAGDNDPDTFRIKIWWEMNDGSEWPIYDNGVSQAIGGGSIVIHTKK